MTRGDGIVEKGSVKLRELSQKAAARGGAVQKLAQPLAEDSVFLRKLKPSLIYARARGEAPTDGKPGGEPVAAPTPKARSRKRGGGPNPFVVIGATFAVGFLLAKVIDWRGHAHPND